MAACAPIAWRGFSTAAFWMSVSSRPADFDLAAYWQAATIRLEAEMHPNYATVRLSPFGVKLLNALSQPYVRTRTRIEDTADAAGWRIAAVPIGKTVWHAAAELLRLGAEAEVLAPAELRDRMAELTQAMAARYRTAQEVIPLERISADLVPRNIPETRFSPAHVNARRRRCRLMGRDATTASRQ